MDSPKKKRCEWLKSIDQIGVPVSMQYQGDATKSSRFGGLVSIVGIVFVATFLFGTISMYVAFSNVKTNNTISGVNARKLMNCTAEDN